MGLLWRTGGWWRFLFPGFLGLSKSKVYLSGAEYDTKEKREDVIQRLSFYPYSKVVNTIRGAG